MASNADSSTINPREVAHFAAQSADWWNPKGSSAMLHRLNPVRLAYIREEANRHFNLSPDSLKPLAGKRALDVGCGAGLVCEPLARLGAEVTGIDATPENIAVAKAHATDTCLTIDYIAGGVENLDRAPFDLITCLEVVEHVEEPELFIGNLARLLAPGGLLIMSTPNRTAKSRLAMITLAEGLNMVPRGTHQWTSFLKPEELTELLEKSGLTTGDMIGIGLNPAKGFVRSDDLSINYMLTATHGNMTPPTR